MSTEAMISMEQCAEFKRQALEEQRKEIAGNVAQVLAKKRKSLDFYAGFEHEECVQLSFLKELTPAIMNAILQPSTDKGKIGE